ncbi:MAG: YggS family pyridoxal phosphate-dependent enzyme [Gammaproteobacteria bacterium]|nr:YggS family pyridoxal phosphate-dependent enzyme [Gammaproteobacteria bacterium]
MPEISHRLQQVYNEILDYEEEFSKKPHSVNLIAVSKTRSASDIEEACKFGQTQFGESYLQEALDKIKQLQAYDLEWHFIGPIQSNKTRAIAENFTFVHSVDRLKIAQRLNEQRPKNLPPLQILIQVNTNNETSKSGCHFDELTRLASAIQTLPHLKLRGLMAIPVHEDDFEKQRLPFRQLHDAMEQLNGKGFKLDTLSMGMSKDIRAAIAEGATMVRVGTGIFGARK